jgi:hypothetical protein
MKIAVTPAQFTTLQAKLQSESGVTVTPITPMTGAITTSDVTLSYAYDGTDSVDVEVTAKHSFKAKLASESQIESRINALFAEAVA